MQLFVHKTDICDPQFLYRFVAFPTYRCKDKRGKVSEKAGRATVDHLRRQEQDRGFAVMGYEEPP